MKKCTQRLMIALMASAPMYGMQELGKHDGGEYFYRASKNISGTSHGLHACDLSKGKSGSDELFDKPIDFAPYEDDMDFEKFKQMFPIFKTTMRGRPLVYFDTASTSQMPQEVADAITQYYLEYKSNVGRGLYEHAEHATLAFEQTRCKVAGFLGAQNAEIVFTAGATAGINMVAHIWAEHHVQQGDEIVISEAEHNANFIPWQQLALRKGAILKRVPVDGQGRITPESFAAHITSKTKLVAVTHQSNILGMVTDVKTIAQYAHAVGAKVLIDAAQSIAHQRINVKELGCDFLVFSAHKLFGPTGVGVLFIDQSVAPECVLHNFGGGMVYYVTPEFTQFKKIPHGLEPGTQAIAQVIGLGAVIDFVQKYINFEQVQEHETALALKLIEALQTIDGLRVISAIPQAGEHCSMVTFTTEGFHPYDVAEYLDQHGIAVRSGYHCVQPYHDALGGLASVRVSISPYNNMQDIEWVIACLQKMVQESEKIVE